MAKKLKPTPKLGNMTNKKAKNIFDMGDRAIPGSAKLANTLNSAIKNDLTESKIPVLQTFASTENVLNLFFMNRKMINFVMGDHAIIFDRIVRDEIASLIASEVMRELAVKYIPGYWSQHMLIALARNFINIVTPVDHPEYDAYLSAHELDPEEPITSAVIKDWPAATCMRFKDFNPNRLFQFYTVATAVVFNVVVAELEHTIPAANLVHPDLIASSHSHSAAVRRRYARDFIDFIRDPYNTWMDTNVEREDVTLDDKLQDHTHFLANGLQNYAYKILPTLGISETAIDKFFEEYEAKAFYDPSGIQSIRMLDMSTSTVTVLYRPKNTILSRGPGARIIIYLSEIATLACNPSIQKEVNLGKKLEKFLNEIMAIIIYHYKEWYENYQPKEWETGPDVGAEILEPYEERDTEPKDEAEDITIPDESTEENS